MATFEAAIGTILEHEGSKFTNYKGDPGGATKWGITLRSAQSDLADLDLNHDGRVDVEELKGLTVDQAKAYYCREWWKSIYALFHEQLIATKVLDTAVNVGSAPAHKYLQLALNQLDYIVSVDGICGPQTVAYCNTAVTEHGLEKVLDAYSDFQSDHYQEWINHKAERIKFKNGLMARAAWPKIYSAEKES